MLHDLGLSCAAIATVMTFDFPDTPLKAAQVEYAIKHGTMPLRYRKLDLARDAADHGATKP